VSAPTDAQLRDAAWRSGDLRYLLHEGQASVLSRFALSPSRRFVVECARRWGKSWLACVLAVMFALLKPRSQIRYAAPTQKMVKTIVTPLLREILEDCPADLRPTFSVQDGIWRFPNGSEIHIAGVDNQGADRLRGVSTDLAIVDEAGFVDELGYLVTSVLLPQLLTVEGRMLLISTPATSPDHEFTSYCIEAEGTSSYAHATIYQAPHVTEGQIEEYKREAGGERSAAWQREGLARRVVDSTRAVVPEFSEVEGEIVRPAIRPPHFHCWVSLDLGFYDMSVALLAWGDFKRAKLVVAREVVRQRARSREVNEAVRAAEVETFGAVQPLQRVIDAPAITVADMDDKSLGMSWALTAKDDAEAALNALRMAIANRQIEIDPSCKVLISHLRNGIWNKSRTAFERVRTEREEHHFDGIDAAKYLVRHADLKLNPYPLLPPGVSPDTHHIPPMRTKEDAVLGRLFGGSRSR
jgi:hypothetical protein